MSSYDSSPVPGRPRGRRLLTWLFLAILVGLAMLVFTNYHNMGNMVRVVGLVRSEFLFPVSSSQMMEGAMKGLVGSLDDPYSAYLDQETFSALKEQIRGSFAGLGILVGVREHRVAVVRAYKETPAYREGVKDGDLIIKIDELDTEDLDLDQAISLMRGSVGTKVTLTISRQGEPELLVFNLTREEITVPTVEARLIDDESIEYITISQFTERTGAEMRKALEQTLDDQARGVVLDLRYNPGGELLAAVEVARNFIPTGPIVFIENRAGKEQVFESYGETINLPLVVLINEDSASASEILAGAVKDTGAGTLVGTRSYGKGIVQTVFNLRDGAGLKLTTAHYLTPDRNNIHEKGIEPDLVIEQDPNNPTQDIQMEKALEVMRETLAGDNPPRQAEAGSTR